MIAARTAAFAAALVALPAAGQVFSGNDLLQRMTSESGASIALGYVAGVSDAFEGDIFCAPEGATLRQASDMVRQWMTDNPQSRHLSGALIVAAVLRQHWPCQAKPQPQPRPQGQPRPQQPAARGDALAPGKTL